MLFSGELCILAVLVSIEATVLGGKSKQNGTDSKKKDEKQLLKDLFHDYDPLAWPFRRQTKPWKITLKFGLVAVINLDEKKQILSTSGYFLLKWVDDMLTWDPKEYDAEILYVPREKIWTPQIVIKNAVEKFGSLGNEKLHANINPNGTVVWYPGDFYKTYCQVDIKYYPFDTQECTINIFYWGCPIRPLNLTFDDTPVKLHLHEPNGEWYVVHVNGDKPPLMEGHQFYLKVKIQLARRKLFYVVNMILPIVFLSLLNFLAFALPAECGEKMTLCISVLLSYAVFLTLVIDTLPENSEDICFFSAYLASEIFLSATSTLATAVILSMYHKPGHKWVSKRFLWILTDMKATKDEVMIFEDGKVWATKCLDKSGKEFSEDVSDVKKEGKFVLWKDISRSLDFIALRGFVLANIVVTIVFFFAMLGY